MQEAYLIRRTDDYERYRYAVGGTSAFTVPYVICPDCGEIQSWGLSYPSIDVGGLGEAVTQHLDSSESDDFQTLTVEQYRALEGLLEPVLGPDRPLAPRTGLGPTSGGAEGRLPDIAWPLLPGEMFVRRSAFEAMRDAGFALTGVAPDMAYRRPRKDPLVELEILPSLHVIEWQRPEPCATCGFARERPQGVRLSAAAWDDAIPLQRIAERPELIVANAALAAFIRERELTDVRLTPMIFE